MKIQILPEKRGWGRSDKGEGENAGRTGKAGSRQERKEKANQKQWTMKDMKILKIKGRIQNPEFRNQNGKDRLR